MLIDAHAHLDKYDPTELDLVLDEIDRRRIGTISVSIDPASFVAAESIAARSELVLATFGIHPSEAPAWVDRLDDIDELMDRSPMIGEVGLDHRFVVDTARHGSQRIVFDRMVDRAVTSGKVLNVHCAGAEAEALATLLGREASRVIVHWYHGPDHPLEGMIAAGYMLTVSVEVLYSERVRRIAARIPDHLLLTETDNPGGQRWLTGDVGMPDRLDAVLEELARLRGVIPESIESLVHANLKRLFAGDTHVDGWAALD
ncbi:MAG TPA: TatD family hydrolase [Acidimicrobiia bacterium]|nr:TatD family hydrolase [Acidimicrobiia bacterium]